MPELLSYVGKESNRQAEVETGLEHDPDEVYKAYGDPERDVRRTLVLLVLREMPSKVLAGATGVSARSIREFRNGHSMPRPRHRAGLLRVAIEFARDRLGELGITPPTDDLATCAAYLHESAQRVGRTALDP